MSLQTTLLLIVLAPLGGAILAGFFRNQIGRVGSHTVTILGVALSFVLSAWVLKQQGEPVHSVNELDDWTGRTDEIGHDHEVYAPAAMAADHLTRR